MTKLSDTQRMILSAASQHALGLARAPKTLRPSGVVWRVRDGATLCFSCDRRIAMARPRGRWRTGRAH